jgi:ferredoxin-type protein NapH
MVKKKFYKKLNFYRKLTQVLTLLFFLIIPVLLLLDFRKVIGNLYSITIFGFDIVDPAMAIQTFILTGNFFIPMIIGIILPVVIAFIFGRVFCSWVCPYNTIAEFLTKISNKFFNYRKKPGKNINPKPYYYWTILGLIIFLTLLIGFPFLSFLSAPGIITAQMASIILGMGVGLEIAAVGLIWILEVITKKRFWCKYVCPVGAVLSIFRTPNTMKVAYNSTECKCGLNVEPCAYNCPLDLSPKEIYLYPYCNNCGLCLRACERTGNQAVYFTFKKSTKR